MGDNANERAKLDHMDLLPNQDGLGKNDYIALSEYTTRKEIFDKLRVDDPNVRGASFATEQSNKPNKCQFIIPIANVVGKIKHRAAGTNTQAVEARDLPPTYRELRKMDHEKFMNQTLQEQICGDHNTIQRTSIQSARLSKILTQNNWQ